MDEEISEIRSAPPYPSNGMSEVTKSNVLIYLVNTKRYSALMSVYNQKKI